MRWDFFMNPVIVEWNAVCVFLDSRHSPFPERWAAAPTGERSPFSQRRFPRWSQRTAHEIVEIFTT